MTAELAGAPYGELRVTKLADGTFCADRADPRVLISAAVLDAVTENRWEGGDAFRLGTSGRETYVGALVKIAGGERMVVYRIKEWLPGIRAYVAEWPD